PVIEPIQVERVDRLEFNIAESRQHVRLDLLPVARDGGGTATSRRQRIEPGAEIRPQRDLRGLHHGPALHGGELASQLFLSLPSSSEDAHFDLSALTTVSQYLV